MRKLFLIVLVLFAFIKVDAQKFNVGLHLGLPSGDSNEYYTYSAALDLSYLYELADKLEVGLATGLLFNKGDFTRTGRSLPGGIVEFLDVDSSIFIPVAAAGRYSFSHLLSFEADLGYAFGVSSNNVRDIVGGFYIAPKLLIGVNQFEDFHLIFSYRTVTGDRYYSETIGNIGGVGSNLGVFTAGIEYSF